MFGLGLVESESLDITPVTNSERKCMASALLVHSASCLLDQQRLIAQPQLATGYLDSDGWATYLSVVLLLRRASLWSCASRYRLLCQHQGIPWSARTLDSMFQEPAPAACYRYRRAMKQNSWKVPSQDALLPLASELPELLKMRLCFCNNPWELALYELLLTYASHTRMGAWQSCYRCTDVRPSTLLSTKRT